jgi:hypothetical protein
LRRDRIFVERKYELVTEAGEKRDVVLRIGAPEPDGRIGSFCPIEISGLDTHVPRGAHGVDGIHALTLSLHLAHVVLRYSDEFRAGRLRFLETRELHLPGLDNLESVRFDALFQDEGCFAALLGALLVSTSPFAWRFREALGHKLGLSMGLAPVETFVGSKVGFASATVGSTLDVIAHPDARTVLAIGLVVRADQPRFDAIEEAYRRLRAEEDEGARRARRPARRIQTVVIAPSGTAPLAHRAVETDTWQLLDWQALFRIFEWCQVVEGNLSEPILPALCRGAVSGFESVEKNGRRQWSPAVPDRERMWAALQAAADEFRRTCRSDPSLKEITWEPESYRSDKSDSISGSFRPGNPPPRFRRLSLISVPGEGTQPFRVRLHVCASRGMPRDSEAWEVRHRELHESAKTLSWMNDYQREQPDEILHEFVADLAGTEISACERPLENLLTDGLVAYARAFRGYLVRAPADRERQDRSIVNARIGPS